MLSPDSPAATANMPRRTRRSRATISITCGWPPWLFTITNLRMPARWTHSPSSVHIAISVSARKVSVPGKARCSFDLPTWLVGSTSTLSGISGMAAAITPSLMKSVHADRQMRPVLLDRRHRQDRDRALDSGVQMLEFRPGRGRATSAPP